MPTKKSKTKKVVKNKITKATKKLASKKILKAAKKPEKNSIKKSKITKKLVKKTAVEKVANKPNKKADISLTKKVSKKFIEKKNPVNLQKKEAKKIKIKSDIKTSAKIIAAKGKKSENKIKEIEKTPEKKETQKNLIIVKKLSESRNKIIFKSGDYAVYPSHGVGKIIDIEKTLVLGQDFSCYLMYFEKEKLTIKIPVNSAEKIGLRHLVSKSEMEEVFSTLRSGVKKLKGMWSRRAQEYETKINSGDIMLLAEVLRDLTRDIEDGDRSYSERIIYETAVHRLAAEYSVIYGIEFEEAKEKVISTAKDKLGVEGKINQKDEFDDFDYDSEKSEDDEDDDENDEEEEEDDFNYEAPSDDEDYDDEDDLPKKKKKK